MHPINAREFNFKTMNIRKVLAVAAMALLPLSGTAANYITWEAPFGPSTVPFGFTPVQTVYLPQFGLNSTLLTKVTLGIEATLGADITAENNTDQTVYASAWIAGNVSAVGGGLSPAIAFGSIIAGPIKLTPWGTANDSTDFGGHLSDTQSSSASTTSAFDPFLGGGTFPVTYKGNGGWAVFGISDATVNVSNFRGSGKVFVTYEYVPEPSQFAVIAGLGLVLFAGARRFRG